MSLFDKDCDSKKAYAILSCIEGSWIVDALHDITNKQKQAIIEQFIANFGNEALVEAVKHVECEYSLATVPNFMIGK